MTCRCLRVSSLALACAVLAPPAAADGFGFAPPLALAAGPAPGRLELRDMNADGQLDVVLLSTTDGKARVLLNASEHAFQALVVSALGGVPFDWTLGDLDADGLPDLAASFGGVPPRVALFTSDGTGHFAPAGEILVSGPHAPPAVAIADLDEDGLGDVLVQQPTALRVFLADGAGGFAETAPALSAAGGLSDLHAVDADQDGHADLLSVQAGGALDWLLLLGDGRGAFEPAPGPSEGTCKADVNGSAVGDVNGDHRPDFVIAFHDLCLPGIGVALAIGLSDGSGISGQYPEDCAQTQTAYARIAVGDLTGDGLGEVVSTHTAGASVLWLMHGYGDGTFAFGNSIYVGKLSDDVAIGDLDGDGRADIATSNTADDAVTLLFNTTTPLPGWNGAGGGLAGTAGKKPYLSGTGPLVGGGAVQLQLAFALPHAPATLVIGLQKVNAVFKGGLMMPSPDIVVSGLVVTHSGTLTLPGTWPAGLPAGFTCWMQMWVQDAGGPKGFAVSTGLSAQVPGP